MYILLILFMLFVFPGVLGAVATAETGAGTTGSSANSSLGWMRISDSQGVQLSSYLFATDHGGVLNPGNTVTSSIIGLEFAGWKIIVTTSIWLIGYALSFRWLDMFSNALTGMAHSLTGQIATPMMLLTAAAIGAFFVAWFITRGFYAKATTQVVTMLGVAILGPLFLAEPLADVLSSHGLLAQGRDLGISVAAGLNGNETKDPSGMVATMQNTLADNFARRPLQVWNFGHVVDDKPACRAAWSAGVNASSENRVKNGIRSCGDSVARESIDNPNFEQVGTGLLLLLSGTVLLAFAAVLAIKVIKAALDTIYHGLMSIFGFAAGGFIYGPTQTFLVRNMVDSVIAAARMTVFTIFLGVYVLLLGNLFRLAGDQVMTVFIVGGIVEIVAIFQLKRISRSLDRGNEWLANRFALTIQGNGGGRSSSSGATALGMGAAAAKQSFPGASVLAGLAAVSTVSNSPATEWLWGRTRSPLRPFARAERTSQLAQWGLWGRHGFGGPEGHYAQSYMNRKMFGDAASKAVLASRKAHGVAGGVNTYRGAAAALQGLEDVGGKVSDGWGALTAAGFTDDNVMFNAIRSWGIVDANSDDWTLADKHLGHVVAAVQRAQDSSLRLLRGEGASEEAAADLATLQAAAFRYRRANPGGVTLDGGATHGPRPQQAFVDDFMLSPTQAKIKQLQQLANGDVSAATGMLTNIDQTDAGRMMQWIGNEHAVRTLTAVDNVLANPADGELLREARRAIVAATDTDQWAAGASRTPWNSLATPGSGNSALPGWSPAMGGVGNLLNN